MGLHVIVPESLQGAMRFKEGDDGMVYDCWAGQDNWQPAMRMGKISCEVWVHDRQIIWKQCTEQMIQTKLPGVPQRVKFPVGHPRKNLGAMT